MKNDVDIQEGQYSNVIVQERQDELASLIVKCDADLQHLKRLENRRATRVARKALVIEAELLSSSQECVEVKTRRRRKR